MSFFVKSLATFFWVGLLPGFPGTWGSLVTAILFYSLAQLFSLYGFLLLILFLLILGVYVCGYYAKLIDKKDPSEAVLDEVAGQLVAYVPLFWLNNPVDWSLVILGFVLFRFFDIIKPLGISRVEKLPGGWGIMLDDILAGIYAAIILGVTILWLVK